MSVILRLQNLPWSANASDIRKFFHGLTIPEGGVHIVGGESGDAFISFSTDEDARLAMQRDSQTINHVGVRLYLSSKTEMMRVILASRKGGSALREAGCISSEPPTDEVASTPLSPSPDPELVSFASAQDSSVLSYSVASFSSPNHMSFSTVAAVTEASPSTQAIGLPYSVFDPSEVPPAPTSVSNYKRADASPPLYEAYQSNTTHFDRSMYYGSEPVSASMNVSRPITSGEYTAVPSWQLGRQELTRLSSRAAAVAPSAPRCLMPFPPTRPMAVRSHSHDKPHFISPPVNPLPVPRPPPLQPSPSQQPPTKRAKPTDVRPSQQQYESSISARPNFSLVPSQTQAKDTHHSQLEQSSATVLQKYFVRYVSHPNCMQVRALLREMGSRGVRVTPHTGIRIEVDELSRETGTAIIQLQDHGSLMKVLQIPTKRVQGVAAFVREADESQFNMVSVSVQHSKVGKKAATTASQHTLSSPSSAWSLYRNDFVVEIQNLPPNTPPDALVTFIHLDSLAVNDVYVGNTVNVYCKMTRAFVQCVNQTAVDVVKGKNNATFSLNGTSRTLRIAQTSRERFHAFQFESQPVISSSNRPAQLLPPTPAVAAAAVNNKASELSSPRNMMLNGSKVINGSNASKPSMVTESNPAPVVGVVVEPTVPPKEDVMTCIQVNNVPKSGTVKDILALFHMTQLVAEDTVRRDEVNNRMFIEFQTAADCAKASVIKSKMYRGYPVRLLPLTKEQMLEMQPQNSHSRQTILMKNLPMNTTTEQIKELLTGYDMIPQSITLRYTSLGKPIGEATVDMKSHQEAQRARDSIKHFSNRRILLDLI